MKMPQEETLRSLCAQMGVDRETLAFIGGGREDSDGVVYRAKGERAAEIIKVVSIATQSMSLVTDMDARFAFARFLSDNGVSVAAPVALADGSLYVSHFEEETLYVGYRMQALPGTHPTPDMQTPELARAWGAMTGRAHAVTQEYPLWRSMHNSAREFDDRDEMAGFLSMCEENADLKARWADMWRRMDELPRERACYGFIHNDNHEQNVLWESGQLSLIDFDVAQCQFFLHDITTPLQGLLFAHGGMCAPLGDVDRVKRFLEAFLSGYETQYHLDGAWLARVDLFIRYRRLLLATVLQGLLRERPEMARGFAEQMDAPELFRL